MEEEMECEGGLLLS